MSSENINNIENIPVKVVPVQEIIQRLNTENLMSVEDQLKKVGRDSSSRKKMAFGSPQGTPYAMEITSACRSDEQARKAFENFKDQIVVELAAGWEPYGYYLSKAAGAKAYIAVEPYWPDKLIAKFEKPYLGHFDEYKNLRDIPASVIPEDMLTFLKRLPDESVSIFTSGIDEAILEKEYMKLVEKEMVRVLSKNGSIVAYSSYLQPSELENKIIYSERASSPINVLTKNL